MLRTQEPLSICGDFASLGAFLEEFACYIKRCWATNQPIDASKVRDLAVKHHNILKQTGVDAAVILPPSKGLENSGGWSSKRTWFVSESERRMSNVEGEARLQNEEEGPETPTKTRRMNDVEPLEL
ncbi:hypothetical protein FRC04_010040 [Tulasnella sp. 424]|nr:hypothetical protein FRC04_010040 [Tulasnella sp. 424]KAG8972829.1 hypothetical protein FRC05_009551 [Tulasnella sp. 425]